ncbi:uncharacterized protein [Oryctolagus cuniculus]|uniref:uncharacterized protein isoform X2 n=1 Tax=Oryctolagus cuniculus TaxID=9986 RepID=UPI003879A3AE
MLLTEPEGDPAAPGSGQEQERVQVRGFRAISQAHFSSSAPLGSNGLRGPLSHRQTAPPLPLEAQSSSLAPLKDYTSRLDSCVRGTERLFLWRVWHGGLPVTGLHTRRRKQKLRETPRIPLCCVPACPKILTPHTSWSSSLEHVLSHGPKNKEVSSQEQYLQGGPGSWCQRSGNGFNRTLRLHTRRRKQKLREMPRIPQCPVPACPKILTPHNCTHGGESRSLEKRQESPCALFQPVQNSDTSHPFWKQWLSRQQTRPTWRDRGPT